MSSVWLVVIWTSSFSSVVDLITVSTSSLSLVAKQLVWCSDAWWAGLGVELAEFDWPTEGGHGKGEGDPTVLALAVVSAVVGGVW